MDEMAEKLGIDPIDTGEVRVRRMLAVCAAGRIPNPETARSQVIGAMTMGVGELGLCGVGAAVANAIYNATGARVRDYPITLDKLLPHLPAYV